MDCIYSTEKSVNTMVQTWCKKHKQFLAGTTCEQCPEQEVSTEDKLKKGGY